MEECSQSTETCHCRRRSALWSSDEIESDESCCGTPVSGTRCASYRDDEAQVITLPTNMADPRRTSFVTNAGRDDHGTAALLSGLMTQNRPLGNHINPRTQHHSPTRGRTATIADQDDEQVARHGLVAKKTNPVQERCKKNGVQVVGSDGSFEEESFVHKMGNIAAGKEDDVAGAQAFSGEKTRDLQLDGGEGNSGLGFPVHTPPKAKGHFSTSPQIKKNALSSDWKVYSRTRRCQKQFKLGFSNEEHNGTASQINLRSIQHQHMGVKDNSEVAHSEPNVPKARTPVQHELEDDNTGNNQLEEATIIWNMAKELGATCGPK